MDDLKAKAIAIGEELLQKGEKLLNELKHGKSNGQKNDDQSRRCGNGRGNDA